jgi:hypothetical protein
MRLSAAVYVTVLLTVGLAITPSWAETPDELTTETPMVAAEPEAWPASGPYDADASPPSPNSAPVEADSDCLRVIRNTKLSDAEQQIDEKSNVTWIATDAERETPEKCRAIGAR